MNAASGVSTVHDTTALRRAAQDAALAPSIHNTQPWTFVLTHDALEIHADMSRQLTVLDPRGRQLMISCGCALFNARVSLAAAGHTAVVERYPDAKRPHLVARVGVGRRQEWSPLTDLHESIARRHTNRRAFDDEPLPGRITRDLVAAAREEGAAALAITDRNHRLLTARLSTLADRIESTDPAYVDELRRWTTDDPRRRDGVQASSVPLMTHPPAAESLPIRGFDVRGMGWLPSTEFPALDHTLLLIGSRHDDTSAWLRTGEALERVWLELTRAGYAAGPLTQVIEVAETNAQLRAGLGLDLHPEVLLRIGRGPAAQQTPRRAVQDLLEDRTVG